MDQDNLNLPGERTGEEALSAAVADRIIKELKLKPKVLKLKPDPVRVYSRAQEDRLLVLVRAPEEQELRDKNNFKKVGVIKISDAQVTKILDQVSELTATLPEWKNAKLYIGVRDYDRYRAVQSPPRATRTFGFGSGELPPGLLRFYGDQPVRQRPKAKTKR